MATRVAIAGGAELGRLAARLGAGTVHVREAHSGGRGGGAGVVWSDGLVVTNAHVARGRTVTVDLPDGGSVHGQVTARDPWRDLASVRTTTAGIVPLPRAPAAAARPGALAVVVGHPLGWTHALSVGVLHHVERIGPTGPPRWLRADVRLQPGNSGGPLADAAGRVLGLNALIARGTAMAIPVEAVEAFLASDRPRLGVSLRPARVGTRHGRLAMLIVGLESGGAAERAGLLPGDAILDIGGLTIGAPSDVGQILHAIPTGEAAVGVLRGGARLTVPVRVTRGGDAKAA